MACAVPTEEALNTTVRVVLAVNEGIAAPPGIAIMAPLTDRLPTPRAAASSCRRLDKGGKSV